MESLTYSRYLDLDDILAAQHPRSEEPDELLFIVTHQVYELWFKEILHELAQLRDTLELGQATRCLEILRRLLSIWRVTIAQIDVLETLNKAQFANFRARLETASGSQSCQFRQIEAALGRRAPIMVASCPRAGLDRSAVSGRMAEPPVFDQYCRFLAARGYPVPEAFLCRDVNDPYQGSEEVQDVLARVYADDGIEAHIAERLLDLDESIQEWRYRHVQLVMRTIGNACGTGGTSGARYLQRTLCEPVFPDLWAVRGRL